MENKNIDKKSSKIKKKAEEKIQKIFDKMACSDPKKAIHGTALAAAAVVAYLPIGIDAWALRLCEIYMLISIYSHYGIKVSKSVAESLLSAAFMQAAGETAAYIALESANAALIATGGISAPVIYSIKLGIAAGLIEGVGWTTVKYLEGNKMAEKVIHSVDAIGAMADAQRVVGAVGDIVSRKSSSVMSGDVNPISFCGQDILKQIHDLEIKIDNQKSTIKQIERFIENDLRFGRDITNNSRDLKFACRDLEKLLNELECLKAKA